MLSQIAADPIRRLVGLVAGSTTLRQFLTVTTLAIGVAATTAAPAAAETRTLELYYVHTKERVSITFKKDGRYVPGGLQQLNRTLRDWRRNEVTRMDPALFDLVWEVWKASGSSQPLNVVSAYRSPATNNMLRSRTRGVAKFSQHMLGKAMDFYVPGVSITALRQIAMKKQVGGVGFYPTANTPFVHLDTGNVRAWPRMSRPQLIALFPDGRTLHVPADGKPLPGYQEALAAYQARKGKSGSTSRMASSGSSSGSFASYSSGDDGGVVRPVGNSGGKGLLAMIFGGGADEAEDNADEESGYAQVPAERSTTRSRMPVNVATARQATGADDDEAPVSRSSRQSLPGVNLTSAPPVTPTERATAAAVAAPPPPAPVPVAAPEAPRAAPVVATPAPVAPAPIPTAAPAAPAAPAPVLAAEPAPAAPVPQAAPLAPTVVARAAPAMPVPAPEAPAAAEPEAAAPVAVVASVLPRPRPAGFVAPAEAAEAVNVATADVPLPLPAAPGRAELARLAAATPAAPPPVMGYANAGEGVVQPGTTDIFAETANALAASRKASVGGPGAADQAAPVGALPPATTLAAVAAGGLAGYTPPRKTRPDPLAAFLTAPDRDDSDLLNGSATLRTVVFAEFTAPVHAGLEALLDAPPVAYQLGFAQRGGLSPRTDRFMGPAIVSLAVLPID